MADVLRRLRCRLLGHDVDAFPLPWYGGGLYFAFGMDQMTCHRCHRRVLWSVVAHD